MSHQRELKQKEIRRMPKHWEVVRLGGKISLEYGKGLIGLERKNGEYSVFGSNGIVGYHNDFLIKGPGIVVGRKGTIGAINWSEDNFWPIDTTYFVKVIGNDVDLRWLYYKLTSLSLSKLNMATGTPGLNRDLVYAQVTPFPPLPEQKKIAEILSTVDEAIEKVDEAIEKTQKLKKGLMQELLTKGIGHKEFRDTEIGRIPKEWEVVRLNDISLDLIGGGTPLTSNPDYWNGDIAWMTSAHIDGREIKNGQRYITKEGLKNSATNLILKNNVLVATRVGIGKVAVNKIDIAISQDLTGVVINQKLAIPDFIYWNLVNNAKRLKALAQGSTIKGVLREDLGKMQLPLPSLPEQQQIAEMLGVVDERLKLLRKRKERLERTKKGLMNDLLTGKVRVKKLIEREARDSSLRPRSGQAYYRSSE